VKVCGGRTHRVWAPDGLRAPRPHRTKTGIEVDADDGELCFAPFASTTTERDHPVLGQGMGLGLPITGRWSRDYRGSIRFVEPRTGFATAVQCASL